MFLTFFEEPLYKLRFISVNKPHDNERPENSICAMVMFGETQAVMKINKF